MRDSYIDNTATTMNVRLNHGAEIWKHSLVRNTSMESFSKINDFCRVENSELGVHTDLQRYAMVYNSMIGDYTYTGRNFVCWHARIGKFCSISWNVSIGGANHDYTRISQHAFLYAPQFGILGKESNPGYNRFEDKCIIGNDVWIACNVVICRGITVGDGAVIAAGAIVTKDCDPYTIYAGVPAKPIKRRCSRYLADRLIKTAWWNLPADLIREHFELFNSQISLESVEKIEQLVQQLN